MADLRLPIPLWDRLTARMNLEQERIEFDTENGLPLIDPA
jgi:hypothetical protein